jgi:hypothetical protein
MGVAKCINGKWYYPPNWDGPTNEELIESYKEKQKMNTKIVTARSIQTERLTTDELVALSANLRATEAEYPLFGLPVPEWVGDSRREVTRELKTRVEDAKRRRAKEIEASLEAVKTRVERKAALEAELAALRASTG